MFRQTLGVRMEHRPASAGSHAHHMAQIEIVRDFFASATLSALSDLPFIVLYVAMIFFTAGELGWVMVIAIPLLLGPRGGDPGVAAPHDARQHGGRQADLQGVLVESIEGLEDLKAAGAQGRFLERYETATAAAAESALRARWMGAWTNRHLDGRPAAREPRDAGLGRLPDSRRPADRRRADRRDHVRGPRRGAARQRGQPGDALPGGARGDGLARPVDGVAGRTRTRPHLRGAFEAQRPHRPARSRLRLPGTGPRPGAAGAERRDAEVRGRREGGRARPHRQRQIDHPAAARGALPADAGPCRGRRHRRAPDRPGRLPRPGRLRLAGAAALPRHAARERDDGARGHRPGAACSKWRS